MVERGCQKLGNKIKIITKMTKLYQSFEFSLLICFQTIFASSHIRFDVHRPSQNEEIHVTGNSMLFFSEDFWVFRIKKLQFINWQKES